MTAIPGRIVFNRDGDDGDRLDWDIIATCLHSGNLVDHIKAFYDFAKHRVFSIKVRCASYGLIGLALTGREHLAHAALKHVQSPVIIHLALHNLEL